MPTGDNEPLDVPGSRQHEGRRRVRVLVARTVAVLALAVVVAGMVVVGESAGAGRGGLVPLIVGAVVFVAAVPFCGLNSRRPR